MADSSKETKKAQLNEEFWKETENDLRETQDLWWLNEKVVDGKKKTQLEDALEKGRSFKKEELLASKEWLNQDNFRMYVSEAPKGEDLQD